MIQIVGKENFEKTEIKKLTVHKKILGGIDMITTRISREKLYRREYERDTVTNMMNGSFGGETLSGLAKVISIMIKEEKGGK